MSRTSYQEDSSFVKALADVMNVDASFVLDWVAENFEPEDVFEYSALTAWAEAAGFKKEG